MVDVSRIVYNDKINMSTGTNTYRIIDIKVGISLQKYVNLTLC